MPARTTQKIIRHGSDCVVVVPKPYREYRNLKPGKTVIVLYDSLLLIVPKDRENLLKEKARQIDLLLTQTTEEKMLAAEPAELKGERDE